MHLANLKISDYILSYYKITENTPFILKEIDATELLCNSRFDLGAKLYYIHSYVTGTNSTLATDLYNHHLAAFQDGIIREHGNSEKKGYSKFHSTFNALISDFQNGNFNIEQEYIPVDKNMCLLDGAHRVSCSIYFKK